MLIYKGSLGVNNTMQICKTLVVFALLLVPPRAAVAVPLLSSEDLQDDILIAEDTGIIIDVSEPVPMSMPVTTPVDPSVDPSVEPSDASAGDASLDPTPNADPGTSKGENPSVASAEVDCGETVTAESEENPCIKNPDSDMRDSDALPVRGVA